jgi:hypothetical protein
MQDKNEKDLKTSGKKLSLKKDTIRQLRNAKFDGGGAENAVSIACSVHITFCGNCTGHIIC